MPDVNDSAVTVHARRLVSQLEGAAAGVIVAVSGGADSMALFRALGSFEIPLVVAHLNHQLRGPDSDADEAFVRASVDAISARRAASLKFRCQHTNVTEQAHSERGNLEAVARRLRYAWFTELALEEGIPYVATGHTADDQAETILHRILRGTGLKGLRGIAAHRHLAPAVQLVRPLLNVRRHEILDYLRTLGQGFREDTSNRDTRYTRNRIRHELLPLLSDRFNPEIVSVLGRLATEAGSIYDQRLAEAKMLLAASERPRAGDMIVLDSVTLAAASRSHSREVFRLIWEREHWAVGHMDFAAWDRLASLALGEQTSLDLPDGIRARMTTRVIQLWAIS